MVVRLTERRMRFRSLKQRLLPQVSYAQDRLRDRTVDLQSAMAELSHAQQRIVREPFRQSSTRSISDNKARYEAATAAGQS